MQHPISSRTTGFYHDFKSVSPPRIRLKILFGLWLLLMLGEVKAQGGAPPDTLLTQTYHRALDLFGKNQFKASLPIAQLADSLAVNSQYRLQELDGKILLAKIYTALKRPRLVLPVITKCLNLMDQLALSGTVREADIRHLYAGALSELEKFAESEAEYYKTIALKKKIYGDTTTQIGLQLSSLGVLYFRKGQFAQAAEFGKKGIAMREGGVSPNPKLARAYLNFGIINKQSGFYEVALDLYNKVQTIIKTYPGQYDQLLGDLYQSYAALYHDLGDYDKAKEYNDLALPQHRKTYGEQSRPVASVLFNQGLLAVDFQEWDNARQYARQALSVFTDMGEAAPNELADCYEIFSTSYKPSNLDSALYYAQKSFALVDTLQAENRFYRGSSLANLALVYSLLKQWTLADSLMAMAIEDVISVLGNTNHLTANYLSERARMNANAGLYKKALALYDEELQIHRYKPGCNFDTLTTPFLLPESLLERNLTLIRMNRQQKDPELERQIQQGWRAIIRLTDYLRRKHQGSGTKAVFARQFHESADAAIAWCLTKADTAALNLAWTYAEKSRSLTLLEAVRKANATHFAGLPDSVRNHEIALNAQINNWEKLRQDAETPAERDSLYQLWFAARREQEDWLKTIEKKYPAFYRLKYENKVVSMAEARRLLRPDQALVEYFVGDSSIYIFVVTKAPIANPTVKNAYRTIPLRGGGVIVEVPKDFPLEHWIDQFRQGLYGYHALPVSEQTDLIQEKTYGQYVDFGQRLYQKLFQPIQHLLPLSVIVVPDGPLGNIPFGTLLSDTPQDVFNFQTYPYLLEKHQISYTYSTTLYQQINTQPHARKTANKIFGLAPYYLPEQQTALRVNSAPLKYSAIEVGHARNAMGGDTLLGVTATKDRFLRLAATYRFIHLATHGIADYRVGDYSFLLFAAGKDGNNERLYVRDLYNLELDADLVVLSACETGIGSLQRGEGIISLARAFAYAGAKNIVTTLWSVNDKSTTDLMGYFYENLKKNGSVDAALCAAQSNYVRAASPENCHPYFWGAFIPLGSMQAIR